MSKDTSNELPPFEPNDPTSDASWLPLCAPQDRLAYMTAKGVYDTAMATAHQATTAAGLARDQAIAKATTAFNNSQAAAVAAGESLDILVLVANSKKDAISDTPDMDLGKVRADPSQPTAQSDAVKAAVATYATAIAAVIAAQPPYAAALAALAKLAILVDPANPGSAQQSGDAASIAEANCDIAIATATTAKDKAENVFNGVRFALWTKLNDQG